MNIVASKWVFRIKRIVNGEIFIFFLSVEATWHNDDLHLSQQRYIHDLLTKTNMLLAKPIATPMSASSTLSCFEGYTITDPTQYRSTVGSLQYLSLTRPDIAFAVNKVSQFMQDPRDTYWSAVKRILRYLKSTILILSPFQRILQSISLLTQIPIGLVVLMTGALLPGIVSLVKTSYPGAPRNNPRCLDLAPNLSTGPLRIQLLS
jgi:hypothetical protein